MQGVGRVGGREDVDVRSENLTVPNKKLRILFHIFRDEEPRIQRATEDVRRLFKIFFHILFHIFFGRFLSDTGVTKGSVSRMS